MTAHPDAIHRGTCGMCGHKIHRDSAVDHCGTYVKHRGNYECVRLLQLRITELESGLKAILAAIEPLAGTEA